MSGVPDKVIGPGVNNISAGVKFTVDGGLAILLENDTGADSVKGTIVRASTSTDDAFEVNPTSNPQPIGVVLEDGVADGDPCWVVVAGVAEVLLKNSTGATRGYWVKQSDTAGRADATNAAPPGGGVTELDQHMTEIGHSLETVSGGTDVLARMVIHFN